MSMAGEGLVEARPESKGPSPEPAFFPASLTKICVLSLCSFGCYGIYWFYRNWKIVRDVHKEDVSPIARTVFGYLFCYALFSRIAARGEAAHLGPLAAGMLTAGYIVLSMLWRLPDPYWLVSVFAFLFLLPVQDYVNRLNLVEAPEHARNDRFSRWNIALIVLGVIWWLLVLAGLWLPDEPEPHHHAGPVAVQGGGPFGDARAG